MLNLDGRKIKVVGNKVLLVRDPQPEDDGIIVIPDEYRLYTCFGRVLQVGERVRNVRPDDRVMFHKHYTYLPFEQRRVAITEDNKIIGIISVVRGRESFMPLNQYVAILPEEGRKVVGGIELPNAPEAATGGRVINVGWECEEVVPNSRVFYNHGLAIECSIGDDKLHIITEEHILCQIPKN